MDLTRENLKISQVESIADIQHDIFQLDCPKCGVTDWNLCTVHNRSTSPLSYVGMKCSCCGRSVIVPTIAVMLQYLGTKVWTN